MADDYDVNGTPPQWALDMAADEADLSSTDCWRAPMYWASAGRSFQALARRIWRTEEPPVDPMLAIMREAIARGSDARHGYSGQPIRSGNYDDGVVAALSYLREVGALVDKLQ